MSLIKMVTYDETGKILCTYSGPEFTLDLISANLRIKLDPSAEVSDDTHYVKDGEIVPLPQNPTTLSGLTLSNVPIPSVIHVNDQPYPCDEDTVELEFEYPGTYHIRVESWPYLDKEFTLEN